MFRKICLATALAVAIGATTGALAQSAQVDIEQRLSADEMHEAGLDTLTPVQLAALNRLLRDKLATPASMPKQAAADSGEAPRGYIGLDDAPIHSRVRGSVAGWEPGTVFVLENGQQWKVLKGQMKLRQALQDPPIVVVPGIAGRWFLQVDEDMPKARVYRID
ncbi:hypothetical protein [Lysobacter solisilvae (ex Woo and Kim 2020)]|uniref:hypothetical protein n=1 Tax=Agrilutibacter terrestris TaxID=2865112 RepID=UPI001CED6C03|nr:hypothetical protein [Lysobacter terrestris]